MMKTKTTTLTQANAWTEELIAAAIDASKASMGEVNSNYVVGVLKTAITALLLDKKVGEAASFMHNELKLLKTRISK